MALSKVKKYRLKLVLTALVLGVLPFHAIWVFLIMKQIWNINLVLLLLFIVIPWLVVPIILNIFSKTSHWKRAIKLIILNITLVVLILFLNYIGIPVDPMTQGMFIIFIIDIYLRLKRDPNAKLPS